MYQTCQRHQYRRAGAEQPLRGSRTSHRDGHTRASPMPRHEQGWADCRSHPTRASRNWPGFWRGAGVRGSTPRGVFCAHHGTSMGRAGRAPAWGSAGCIPAAQYPGVQSLSGQKAGGLKAPSGGLEVSGRVRRTGRGCPGVKLPGLQAAP